MGYFNGANALMDLIPTSKLNDKNRSYFKANMQYYLNQNGTDKPNWNVNIRGLTVWKLRSASCVKFFLCRHLPAEVIGGRTGTEEARSRNSFFERWRKFTPQATFEIKFYEPWPFSFCFQSCIRFISVSGEYFPGKIHQSALSKQAFRGEIGYSDKKIHITYWS